jgi:hypothetical protein
VSEEFAVPEHLTQEFQEWVYVNFGLSLTEHDGLGPTYFKMKDFGGGGERGPVMWAGDIIARDKQTGEPIVRQPRDEAYVQARTAATARLKRGLSSHRRVLTGKAAVMTLVREVSCAIWPSSISMEIRRPQDCRILTDITHWK